MKIHSLKIRNIGRFNSGAEVSIPFERLGEARLVAIHGANGAGKTTAIECIPGALYRTTPSRGLMASLANAKDSLVEAEIELDQRYRIQLQMDGAAKTPKAAAYIFDAQGEPLNDGKVSTYDRMIAQKFPPKEVLLSSAFAAQNKEGHFLSLPPAERKALFAQMLGLGRLEEMAKMAGEKARAIEMEIARLQERARGYEAQTIRARDLEHDLANARQIHQAAQAEREAAEQAAAKARASLEKWNERLIELNRQFHAACAEVEKCEDRRRALHREWEDLTRQRTRLDEQKKDLQTKLAEEDGLRARAEKLGALKEQLVGLEHQVEGLRQAGYAYQEAMRAWQAKIQDAKDRAMTLEREHQRAYEQLTWSLKAAEENATWAEAAARKLGEVPCHGEGEYAACPLITAATQAKDQLADLRTRRDKLAAEVAEWPDTSSEIDQARDRIKMLADQKPEIPDRTELEQLERQLRPLRGEIADAQTAQAKLEAIADAHRQVGTIDEELLDIKTRLNAQAEEAARSGTQLESAETSRNIAMRHNDEHHAAKPAAVDDEQLDGLRRTETWAAAEMARIEEGLETARKAAENLDQTKAEITATTADLDDWTYLRKALGKDGIQALEIDAAGPEVSDLTNELLHACYGPRFSVSLETTRMKADGKGTKEVFEIRVIDTERGTDLDAVRLSGGEQVLVSEALSLAIAIYNSRRSSIPLLDLFRDECSGALSADNAVLYVEMLRRTLDLGGFHRCYFISHQPELWELADRRIEFKAEQIYIST